jgi:serine/threonine protein kinase
MTNQLPSSNLDILRNIGNVEGSNEKYCQDFFHSRKICWWMFDDRIVSSHAAYKDACAIVMYCGDADKRLVQSDVIDSLDQIHENNVYHCDLRSPNLLHFPCIFHKGGIGKSFIIDFGEAKVSNERQLICDFSCDGARKDLIKALFPDESDYARFKLTFSREALMLDNSYRAYNAYIESL